MIDVGLFISTPLKGLFLLRQQTGRALFAVQSLARIWPSQSGSRGQESHYAVDGGSGAGG